jgi:hypothetical protein
MDAIGSIDDWTQIQGIGPKTVASAKKLLYSEYVPPEQPEEDNSD